MSAVRTFRDSVIWIVRSYRYRYGTECIDIYKLAYLQLHCQSCNLLFEHIGESASKSKTFKIITLKIGRVKGNNSIDLIPQKYGKVLYMHVGKDQENDRLLVVFHSPFSLLSFKYIYTELFIHQLQRQLICTRLALRFLLHVSASNYFQVTSLLLYE